MKLVSLYLCDISKLDRATDLLGTYNNERPYMGLGGITPTKNLGKLNNGNSTASLY
ncbi:transposase [Pseudoalteromonas ulvae UL12]|nr:transposase [Pseudoalteromonas ulvae UL12]